MRRDACTGWTFRTSQSVGDLKKSIKAKGQTGSMGEADDLQLFLAKKDNARLMEKWPQSFEVRACVAPTAPLLLFWDVTANFLNLLPERKGRIDSANGYRNALDLGPRAWLSIIQPNYHLQNYTSWSCVYWTTAYHGSRLWSAGVRFSVDHIIIRFVVYEPFGSRLLSWMLLLYSNQRGLAVSSIQQGRKLSLDFEIEMQSVQESIWQIRSWSRQ